MGKLKTLLLAAVQFGKQRPLLALVLCAVMLGASSVLMHVVEGFPRVACSPCHVMDPYVVGYESGELLSKRHADANVECIDCHENGLDDKIQETVWYVTDDFDDPPYKRDFGNEMCTKCHSDIDAIIAKTNYGHENPHDSHLGELVCADCHQMHDKSHAACADCHSFAFLKELPAEWHDDKQPAL